MCFFNSRFSTSTSVLSTFVFRINSRQCFSQEAASIAFFANPTNMATVREAFLSRVQSFMDLVNHSRNFDDGNIDNILTRGSLLYHHAVRLASVNILGEATITKLRTVVDLLTEMDDSEENFSFQPNVEYTGAPGRPKIRVSKEPFVSTFGRKP